MVAMYTVFGRQVGSHVLAMGVLGTLFAGGFYAGSGSKKPSEQSPPINATSKDEENFIQEFLKNAEAEDNKQKH
ncbi:hypothetical protein EV356DRAFT_530436 [Viridothelium virens]|uniref:ATP synthase subunit K, mitochondrial n=1 Tax=Viridothelium virens TaxID=1048519 RepID=A0A6A6HGF5_VIRVR|nr:hypothetical protein EV356DRAFT_530436 [Viridothelium virens]